ncbi:agmatine deiminase family protein [Maridesulfovibrio sp.]|uniref:agmatine deiminase family protein n=1 Tax=Maridesulfovibrio sp. TaxID=2795000 RepID=UPI0029C9C286|nr:agmatine deiminase family protein [Maridesulfovibrio sp.]
MNNRPVISILCLLMLVAFALPLPASALQASKWRFPAEFEPHETVWMGWLSKEYIKGFNTDTVLLEMARNLAKHVKVRICVPSKEQENHVFSLLNENSVNTSNISFFITPFTMLYWRDFGPIFTVDDRGTKSIADFNFNCWGYTPESHPHARMMERIDRDAAKFLGLSSRMTRLISEGGNRELNGKGSIILTEACEFQRNPNLSRADIEAALSQMLGGTNFIWLKSGILDDDPYNTSTLPGPDGKGVAYRSGSANNHTDEFCRFVAPDTILLAEVSEEEASRGPVEKENRRRMEENVAILKQARDQDGKPFKIVRIPMPELQYFTASPTDAAYLNLASFPQFTDGTVFPFGNPIKLIPAQSYCNFLITNDIVLAQKYWFKGAPESVRKKDEQALKVLQRIFPNRKVIAINTLSINFGGGGIHCTTQQEPAVQEYTK